MIKISNEQMEKLENIVKELQQKKASAFKIVINVLAEWEKLKEVK